MFKSLRLVLALALGALALPLVAAPLSEAGAATKPQCIVSLSPTATETLYAIGAGHQVQAVDTDSDYPTKGLPKKRINALDPSVEALLGICKVTSTHPSAKPDLVVISYDANSIEQKLKALGIDVLFQDAATSVNDALSQIRQLGQSTGHVKNADKLATSLQTTIDNDIKSIPPHPTKVITVYYEIGYNPYYSLTSETFVGSLLKSLGLVNIADGDATSADAGYPELSSEYIISSNPKLILLADGVTPASVEKRPGFAKVNAVANHNIVELNADVASRWGPRLGDLMNELTLDVKVMLSEAKLWKK